MEYDIKSKSLKVGGKKRIEWAANRMPVLEIVRKRFAREKPLKGLSIAACLHVTTETAVLALTLKAGGAKVRLCASNPLSTQDDVAASLVFDYGIETFSLKGEDNKRYYKHIYQALAPKPQITLDDGADLVSTIHKKNLSLPWAGTDYLRTCAVWGSWSYLASVPSAFSKSLAFRYGRGWCTWSSALHHGSR